jgi:phenylpropionate dioxygenase-like ring-hydroxylating dioxygenase large terminal subunit
MEQRQSASKEDSSRSWSRYDQAALGFRNYWYPAVIANNLKAKKPLSVTICGEKIALVRDAGKIYGLSDRCPHRGVPLSLGRSEFPGMLTCRYHGWTYNLKDGQLAAALTDGPNSPICGKANVRVKTYPVAERAGIIWVFIGDDVAPPIDEDIPEVLLAPNAVILPMVDVRKGDWRYAMENAIDAAHAKYLHRDTPFFLFNTIMAYQDDVRLVPCEDGKWLSRKGKPVYGPSDYPNVGRWPKHHWWRRSPRPATGDPKWATAEKHDSNSLVAGGACLPGIYYVGHTDWHDLQMFLPVDEAHHMVWQVSIKNTSGLGKLLWKFRYWTYIRHIHHIVLNRWEDGLMVQNMNCPPERLFRPDVAIVSWRRWCHEKARQSPASMIGQVSATTSDTSRVA